MPLVNGNGDHSGSPELELAFFGCYTPCKRATENRTSGYKYHFTSFTLEAKLTHSENQDACLLPVSRLTAGGCDVL
jgi:hypothetical protein